MCCSRPQNMNKCRCHIDQLSAVPARSLEGARSKSGWQTGTEWVKTDRQEDLKWAKRNEDRWMRMGAGLSPNLHSQFDLLSSLFLRFLSFCLSCSLHPSSVFPFDITQGTNKHSNSTTRHHHWFLSFHRILSLRAEQAVLFHHISLSQPWLVNHAACLSSALWQSNNLLF